MSKIKKGCQFKFFGKKYFFEDDEDFKFWKDIWMLFIFYPEPKENLKEIIK